MLSTHRLSAISGWTATAGTAGRAGARPFAAALTSARWHRSRNKRSWRAASSNREAEPDQQLEAAAQQQQEQTVPPGPRGEKSTVFYPLPSQLALHIPCSNPQTPSHSHATDDDVLPDSLTDALEQAARAACDAFDTGLERCVVRCRVAAPAPHCRCPRCPQPAAQARWPVPTAGRGAAARVLRSAVRAGICRGGGPAALLVRLRRRRAQACGEWAARGGAARGGAGRG